MKKKTPKDPKRTPASASEAIQLDYTGCLRETIGAAGLTRREIEAFCRAAQQAAKKLRRDLDRGTYGFDAILDDRRMLSASRREGLRLARLADTLVVNGIGGSALGPLSLEQALRPARKRLCVLDNVDPEGVSAKLAGLDPRATAINAITKSGSTAETMANLLVLLQWMEKALGPRHVRHWTATTDPAKGDLLLLARRLGIPTLAIPPNVGGRFSVLSPVGLLPAAFLGLDVEALVAGAREMRQHCWSAPPARNLGITGASLLYLLATRRRRAIQVLMPYADGLVSFADWYRQLWAESLGKRCDRRGRKVEVGQTPVTSLGATDQHSQVQLFMEGPHDKVVTFMEVRRFRKDVRIPRLHADLASLGYLAGHSLGELLNAERQGTEVALSEAGRPNFTYSLPRISERVLGQLIYLFEFQTALSGELYGIDAFDQPGVEAGKIATYALMGRQGYEARLAELTRNARRPRAII
ncbi:MAG: glucose-6-phosphate isomerase [Vicinamibacteria bacterium]|jgi:glucose-6-phosphate isomerase|nr:glucose-6-phosphate isomerase [Vicinamibacteria bacterium]